MTERTFTVEEMLAMADMAKSAVTDDSGGSQAFAHTAAMLRQGAAAEAALAEAQRELHALRFALAPASAGPEPWEGMPKAEFFINVARRMHESATKIHALGLTPTQPPQDAEPAT